MSVTCLVACQHPEYCSSLDVLTHESNLELVKLGITLRIDRHSPLYLIHCGVRSALRAILAIEGDVDMWPSQ